MNREIKKRIKGALPAEERPNYRARPGSLPREDKLVELIMGGMGQVEAYRAAGYEARTDEIAKKGVAQVLARPRVVKKMHEIGNRVLDRISLKAEDVIQELRKLAFSDIRDYLDIDTRKLRMIVEQNENGEEEEVWEEIVEMKIKPLKKMKNTEAISRVKQGRYGMEITLHDKTKALEMLGKYFDLFGGDEGNKPPPALDMTNLTDEELLTLHKLGQKMQQKLIA